MKKRALLAATAILFSTIATPAWAAKPPLGPPTTDGLTPQEVCDLQLTPDEHADFETYPVNDSSTGWVNDGPPIQGDPVGDPYGVGIPVPSDNVFDGTYIRHGGSPNVWGGATSTLTYPQTGQLFEFTQHQIQTTTFDCYVFKIVGHDTIVDPAGLQSTGNSIVEEQTIDLPNQEVITNVPFVVYGVSTDVLICISPNNTTKGKPGDWRQMHGFTGSCTDASTIAGTSFIPSHNNPTTDPDISF